MRGIALKRLRNEVEKDEGTPSLLLHEEGVCLEGTSIHIRIPDDYPFGPPRPKLPRCGSYNCFWTWVGVCLHRHNNILYFKCKDTCLGCESPACHWNPSKRIRDVADYVLCVRDTAEIQKKRWIYKLLFETLPPEIVELIVRRAWSSQPCGQVLHVSDGRQ